MDEMQINEEIQYIAEQIIKKHKPLKIILFGSEGWGDFDNENDLDFLIIKEDVQLYGIDRMRELDNLSGDYVLFLWPWTLSLSTDFIHYSSFFNINSKGEIRNKSQRTKSLICH